MPKDWGNAPYIDYLNAVDELLEKQYGITSEQTNLALIAGCQETNYTPEACVDEIATKYDLAPLSEAYMPQVENASKLLRGDVTQIVMELRSRHPVITEATLADMRGHLDRHLGALAQKLGFLGIQISVDPTMDPNSWRIVCGTTIYEYFVGEKKKEDGDAGAMST